MVYLLNPPLAYLGTGRTKNLLVVRGSALSAGGSRGAAIKVSLAIYLHETPTYPQWIERRAIIEPDSREAKPR